jgi:phospholipase/carboxylesterase
MDTPQPMKRREFVAGAASLIATFGLRPLARTTSGRSDPEYGRLTARPTKRPRDPFEAGAHTVTTTDGRTTTIFVPSIVRPDRPTPVVLALHGATGDSDEALRTNHDAADAAGVIVVAPSSEGVTWDAIHGFYGNDFARIDQTLAMVFGHCLIDTRRVGISGFSDGASYALSLGLVNGDLFTHIVAYSAGFIIPGRPHGHPRVFIAHGLQDHILPIDRCGRRIAKELQDDGYVVEFTQFDGGHTVRADVVDRAMHWFTA